MKAYPSIPRSTGQSFEQFEAYVFDKLDGRNVRVEWSKKQGWHKFGSRHRLFDKTDPAFAPAIPLFQETLEEKLTKVVNDGRWDGAVVFMEYWSPTTVAGLANPDGTYNGTTLSVIDFDRYKVGLLGPNEYRSLCEKYELPHAVCLGQVNWTRGFIEKVRNDELPGVTFEGVVGKAKMGPGKRLMAKAKTQKWIDAILALRGEEEGH